MTEKSLTVVIPAFNEEKNIAAAIESVKGALDGFLSEWEIIVVNDGSADQTAALAEAKAAADPRRIRVVHNQENQGYGNAYRRGVDLASCSYVGVFPGDNDMSAVSLRDLMGAIGDADMITAYMADSRSRPLGRRILSRVFVLLVSGLFQLNLKYYNGPFICRRALLQSIPIKSDGLTVLAECKIRLLKRGASFKEVRFDHTGRQGGRSSALRLKSIISVLKSMGGLFMDIHFGRAPKRKA